MPIRCSETSLAAHAREMCDLAHLLPDRCWDSDQLVDWHIMCLCSLLTDFVVFQQIKVLPAMRNPPCT